MTTTGTPRHNGSPGRQSLALPWANGFKSGLLDIPLPLLIYYESRTNICRWSQHYDKDGAYRRWRTDPGIYGDFMEVLNKAMAETLPPRQSIAIDLEPGYNLRKGQIHNFSTWCGIHAIACNGITCSTGRIMDLALMIPGQVDGSMRLYFFYNWRHVTELPECNEEPMTAVIARTSATTLVSIRNTPLFRTALTALTEPSTLWRRITRYSSPRRRVALHSISKMYFSHWSERMWSVNLDTSISGVSDPSRAFLLAFRVTGSAGDKPGRADDKPGSAWERWRQTWERRGHVRQHLKSQSCFQFVFSSMYLCIYVSI